MAQASSVDTKTIQKILSRLDQLSEDIKEIKKKLSEPPYGSEEWWTLSDKKAREDIKAGRYKVFSKPDDLIQDLPKSLK